MALPTETEAREIIARVLGQSRAESCRVSLGGGQSGNVRFARNAVSTSGTTSNMSIVVESSFGTRSGAARANAFDAETIARTVATSEELARLAPEDPEFMPPLGPQSFQPSAAWADATASLDGARRADAARLGIEAGRDAGCVAAGFLEHGASASAIGNSAGLFAYERATSANYTVTMRTPDGTGSGFGTSDSHDATRLDVGAASRIAAQKANASRNPRAIEPGKYTVILEPAASVDLLQYLLFDMSARSADEGRSSFSRKGGTRLGEKLLDERVTIVSDPSDPLAPASTWDGDGRPVGRTTWIDRGTVQNLYYSRYWAAKQKHTATPGPANFLMQGGSKSTEELIAGTERGILVTRTWYIRSVDPQTVLVTGLTRDGTFFIENGKISFPIKNMRFNESPIIMLNNLEAMAAPQRIAGEGINEVMVPPMRIRDFTFSSLSDAV